MRKLFGLAGVILFAATVTCDAATINFDDGTNGSVVGSFYSGLGVTFSNASWTDNGGRTGSSGSLSIIATDNGGVSTNPDQWTNVAPVVALFSSAVTSAGVRGIDVGENGLQIDAFDASVGGSLVDSMTVYGTTQYGVGEFFDLSVHAGSILRVEMYQPKNITDDGIFLEDFSFSGSAATPIPAALPLFVTGFGGLGLLCWFRKKKAALAA